MSVDPGKRARDEEKKMEEITSDPTVAMAFRIISVERDIVALKTQVNLSVPLRENDLNLQIVHSIIDRMEKEVEDAKIHIEDVMKTQVDQRREAQIQLEAQKEKQAALQIKYLWWIISIVMSFIISVLVGYVTHLFH